MSEKRADRSKYPWPDHIVRILARMMNIWDYLECHIGSIYPGMLHQYGDGPIEIPKQGRWLYNDEEKHLEFVDLQYMLDQKLIQPWNFSTYDRRKQWCFAEGTLEKIRNLRYIGRGCVLEATGKMDQDNRFPEHLLLLDCGPLHEKREVSPLDELFEPREI